MPLRCCTRSLSHSPAGEAAGDRCAIALQSRDGQDGPSSAGLCLGRRQLHAKLEEGTCSGIPRQITWGSGQKPLEILILDLDSRPFRAFAMVDCATGSRCPSARTASMPALMDVTSPPTNGRACVTGCRDKEPMGTRRPQSRSMNGEPNCFHSAFACETDDAFTTSTVMRRLAPTPQRSSLWRV